MDGSGGVPTNEPGWLGRPFGLWPGFPLVLVQPSDSKRFPKPISRARQLIQVHAQVMQTVSQILAARKVS